MSKMKDWAGDINELERERAEQNAVIAAQAEDLMSIEFARDRLETEFINFKDVFDSMKDELELSCVKVVDELERVRVDFDLVKKEKEKSEESFEAQLVEFNREKAEQDAVISAQAEELQNLALARDHLQATFDSVKEELEQGRAAALSELKSACVDFDTLKKEKEQSEQSFKSQKKELIEQLDVIEREMAEQGVAIAAQVDEIRSLTLARDRLEAELRSSEEAFHSIKQELEQGCAKVQDELKGIQVDFYVLEKEKEQSEQSLKSDIKELTGKLSATEQEKAEQGVAIAAHVGEIRSLVLAKDHLEAELVSSRSMIRDLEQGRCCVMLQLGSLGYAYVNFSNPNDAARALDMLNFSPLNGRPIRIMFSNRDPSIRRSGAANIFIKKLDKSIDNKGLHETFVQNGAILSCKVATDPNGQSKGYGFVQFEKEEAALKAIQELNDMLLNDKQVFVGPFLRRQERENAATHTKFNNVFVKNLSQSTTEDDLRETFGKFGTITSMVVMKEADGKSKCFGFVNFENPDDVAQAVQELNGKTFDEKEWYVGKTQKKSERENELRGRVVGASRLYGKLGSAVARLFPLCASLGVVPWLDAG